jgi:hypothetical protein
MGGELKTTTAEGDRMTNPRGINKNMRDGLKGEQETLGKRTEGVVNPRETSGCQQRRGETGPCTKPPDLKRRN